jgi:hypothetical protein
MDNRSVLWNKNNNVLTYTHFTLALMIKCRHEHPHRLYGLA